MNQEIIKVLLIQDNEDDYLLINDLLSKLEILKILVDWENTYEGGLAAIEKSQHDVCLVDYSLGEKNGLELLQTKIVQSCKIPIILLTNENDKKLLLQANIQSFKVSQNYHKILLRIYTEDVKNISTLVPHISTSSASLTF